MVKKVIHHSADEETSDILINVLLDRSGSMGGRESDVIGHYNEFIKEQKAVPGTARVSLVIFDTSYEEVYVDRDITEVPKLTSDTYFVRGGTSLLDAVGKFITATDRIKNKPKKILFLINTDGEENSSHEYTKKMVKDLVTERQGKHDWQFLFIGAGVDAFSEKTGAGLGLRSYQTFTSSNSPAGLSNTSNYSSSVTSTYRTTGATGEALFTAALDTADFVPDPTAPKSAGVTIDNKKNAIRKNATRKQKVTTPSGK